MNLEQKSDKSSHNKERPGKRQNSETEAAFFKEEFFNLLKAIRKLDANKKIVKGTLREYVRMTPIIEEYEKVFKNQFISRTAIRNRIYELDQKEFSDDVVKGEPGTKTVQEYFINRLNTKLLEKIFLPDLPKDLDDAIHDVEAMEGELRLKNIVGDEEYDEDAYD